jgi:hypothetical protein
MGGGVCTPRKMVRGGLRLLVLTMKQCDFGCMLVRYFVEGEESLWGPNGLRKTNVLKGRGF